MHISKKLARPAMVAALLIALLVPTYTLAQEEPNKDTTNNNTPVMEEILVEGASLDIADEIEATAKIPGGATLVDMENLKQSSLQNMADMLRYVPGVWASSSSGGDAVFFTSRGSNLDATDYDDNGIKLLQDGLPVTTADGNNHNRAIDPLSARAATVARGANAMTYGASTLGGAINFMTPTGQSMQGVSLRLDSGSFGLAAARVTAVGNADAGDGLILDGVLTLESKSREGYRKHSESSREGLYANAGWQISDSLSTRFYGTWLDNKQDLAGALTRAQVDQDSEQAGSTAVSGNFQLNVKTWRFANRTSWQPNEKQRWEFGVSLEEQHLHHPIVDKVLVDFHGPGPLKPVEVFSLLINTDHRDIGAMLRFQQELGAHEISAGINYGKNRVDGGHYRNDGGRRNGLSTLIDNQAENWEWFAQDQLSLSDQVALTLAVQGVVAKRETRSESVSSGDVAQPEGPHPEGSYDAINPRIGLIWQVADEASVYANLSRLYEPPTNFELQDDIRGSNETLNAMHGRVFEIGTRGTRGNLALDSANTGTANKWFWDLSLYYAQIRDEILSQDDPDAPGTSLSSNVDKTVHAGMEALIGGDFQLGNNSKFRLAPVLSLTLNHFRFDGDPLYGNNDLPAAPDYALRAEVMVRHASGYYAGPVFDLIGKRWADFSNTYEVDSYQLLGLRGGYESQNWRVFMEVQNLLEEDYIATHSVRNLATEDAALLSPGAPLSAYIGLEVMF